MGRDAGFGGALSGGLRVEGSVGGWMEGVWGWAYRGLLDTWYLPTLKRSMCCMQMKLMTRIIWILQDNEDELNLQTTRQQS